MCTLSFLPGEHGYLIAMNRDESKLRPTALPPILHKSGSLSLLYPQEQSGGTWIGANSRGHLFALLNWYSVGTEKLGEKRRSRGEIIPDVLLASDAESANHRLESANFGGIFPFRLLGMFPKERLVREWRWEGNTLSTKFHDWARQHWFSSSRSDQNAEEQRGKTCEQTWRAESSDPVSWLRSLHASHNPEPGPFSICVHREDAATVSYTEVRYYPGELRMNYQPGHPCNAAPMQVLSLNLLADSVTSG